MACPEAVLNHSCRHCNLNARQRPNRRPYLFGSLPIAGPGEMWYDTPMQGKPAQGAMSTPLLTTKLYMPPVGPRLVPRPHLIQQLEEGLHLGRRLTLISAPAGFGKTTLLSDWLRQAQRPAAWLSLDEGDNDPTRFLTYLIAALQEIDPAIGLSAQATLQAAHPLPMESLLITMINDIVATSEPFILVLDDYHMIETSSVHKAVSFLLDHLPPFEQGMHLVIATRADPPLPLARLRGRGLLTELHAADLRFTPSEAGAYLNEKMALNLSPEHVAALEQRTEGWIVGLQLAALALQGTLSLQGHENVGSFVQAFSGSQRYVLDYLTEEVLIRQPEEIQEFLLQTSILDRLTGSLCDAVRLGPAETPSTSTGTAVRLGPAEMPRTSTGTAVTRGVASQKVLEALEASNLFLVRLDEQGYWYRYHHLFADLLRQRLRRGRPDLVTRLHRRASEWYQANEWYPDAVHHSLAAGDEERAAELIGQKGWAMLVRGEMRELLGWLNSLPQDLVSSRPQLGMIHAWALALTGQWNEVEQSLAQIGDGHVPGEMAALQAYVASVQGDVPRTIALCEQASEALPERKWFSRSFVALSLGIAYFAGGQPRAARKALSEAIELCRTSGLTYMMQGTMIELGLVQQTAGSLQEAAQTCRRALELAPGQDVRPVPNVGRAYVCLAKVHYEWNNLERALQYATKGIELTELGGFTSAQLFGYAWLAEVCLARGDMKAASQALDKADRLIQRHRYAGLSGTLTNLRVRSWLRSGDLTAASSWLQEHPPGVGDAPDYPQEIEQITAARVLLGLNQPARALELLRPLQDLADEAGRMWSLIGILVLQGLAFQAQGDDGRALSALKHAMSLAEPEGFMRTFVDEGEPMARLLRRALSERTTRDYAGRLLAAFGESAPEPSPVAQSLVEPLTERELEVLRLIAGGLSNREIAQELVVAVSTVKSHVNHIYGKLDVKNRIQAIARARTLELL
jgi:LuxR family maltose regulon positive regulatory protein